MKSNKKKLNMIKKKGKTKDKYIKSSDKSNIKSSYSKDNISNQLPDIGFVKSMLGM